MPAANPNLEDESENPRVVSPFAQTTSTVQPRQGGNTSSPALYIVSGLLILVVLSVCGYFTYKYLEDPYRTLEACPMDKYLSDYKSLAGAKFKADLKVAADLGWKADTGRLMVFTFQNDSRQIVVLMPPKLGTLFFEKGQNYQVSLNVGEGGLIYADSCDKE